MAKQVIILRSFKGPGGDLGLTYLFWLTVPSGREVPTDNISRWKEASPAENQAIKDGTIIEEYYDTQVPAGTTKAAVQTRLSTAFTVRQTEITNRQNPNQFYGIFLDSVNGWSA
jgi:membrane-associated protease RseP (regulator of RpoE activity)